MAKIDDAITRVLAARDAARNEIFNKTSQLDTRRENILDNAYNRPLTAKELSELQDINSALGSLSTANSDLRLMTIQVLNKTDEVMRLNHVLDAANNDLTEKLANVKSIAENIKKLQDIFDKFTKLVGAVTKLIPLLA